MFKRRSLLIVRLVAAAAGAATLFAAGLRGQAPATDGVLFDGEMEYVRVEAEESLADLDALTLSVWVKLNQASGIQTFMNRGARGQLFTLYLFNDHVRMLVEYGTSGQYRHASTLPPPANSWVHYTGTYDGETIRLYVNGTEVDSTVAVGRIPVRDDPLFIGATSPFLNGVGGRLADVRIYRVALTPSQVGEVFAGEEPAPEAVILRFTDAELEALIRSDFPDTPDGEEPEYPFANGTLATTDGFRGIWYLNGRSDDGLHKYSGGLGTYPQQHHPIAIYAEAVNKTFFTYGGTRKDRNRLLHMVSAYDHQTGKVARPRILLDKMTSDAHDNPTMAIDADGHIWIFSNAHGTSRPSYIHRSTEPYSIESFNRQVTTNFSYSQPWHIPEHGFVFLHTLYAQGRRLFVENSLNGVDWGGPRPLAHIKNGHYQISWPRGGAIGTAFNYHPDGSSPLGSGLNYRTNLYYMESDDGGHTWRNVQGEPLALPLTEIENPALAVEYESGLTIVYLKDIQYTAEGHPVILHLTTPGWQSGPANDPRTLTTARWTGSEWRTRPVTTTDNNYDFASLYIETDGLWRIIGSTETGPQAYNTGGEMAMWTSTDEGETWELIRHLTGNSEYNHTYPRRPLNAHPGFYAFWADGHGREASPSRFYFTTREGDVFRLPYQIAGDDLWVDPEPMPAPPPPPPPKRLDPFEGRARLVYDAGGFEDDDVFPPGALQNVQHGSGHWTPHSSAPAQIVSAGAPFHKVLRISTRNGLNFPPLDSGIVTLELDVRVSSPHVRTLDLSFTAVGGDGTQRSFIGWGTVAGSFTYYDGSNWIPVFQLGTDWHRYKMVNYLTGAYASSYDLFVDGVLIGEKLPFRAAFNPDIHVFSRIRLNASSGTDFAEIDNLVLTVQPLMGDGDLPFSVSRLESHSGHAVSISFETYAGYNYVVEFSDALDAGFWTELTTVPGSGGTIAVNDPGAGGDRRFYRIRTVPGN